MIMFLLETIGRIGYFIGGVAASLIIIAATISYLKIVIGNHIDDIKTRRR